MNSGAIKMLQVPLGFAACYQRDARTKSHFGATKTHFGATKRSLTRVCRAREKSPDALAQGDSEIIFCERLKMSFTHQHVYELRHVGNGELGNATFVMPALCLSVAVQQLVDERRHVGDGHPTVAVDVE